MNAQPDAPTLPELLSSIVINADALADQLYWEEDLDRDYMLELINKILDDAKRASE